MALLTTATLGETDANGNRTEQTETRGDVTLGKTFHWNAQDQLVAVEQDAQTLATYRYDASDRRSEKALTPQGLANAQQNSQGGSAALANERIQWDGLTARRRYRLDDSTQTPTQILLSDTDAGVSAGNDTPLLFNRTTYPNGIGSTPIRTSLHTDSNGSVIATTGVNQTPSLLTYTAYGALETAASVNADTALQSNANSFASYYADPETGLLYARARYYDPASGQFISRDPLEGEATLPITWAPYPYARYNPYRYNDPTGKCFDESECVDLVAIIEGWDNQRYAEEQQLRRNAEIKANGELYGTARSLAASTYNLAKTGGKLLGAALEIPGSESVFDDIAQGIQGIVSTVKAGPQGLVDYLADVSRQSEQLTKDGHYLEAGEVYGDRDAAILGLALPATRMLKIAGEAAVADSAALAKVEPVLAAKNPMPVTEEVQSVPKIDANTPILITEGPGIEVTGQWMPETRSVRAAGSGEAANTAAGTANSVSGARLAMQLSAEEAAGAQAPMSISSYSNHASQQIVGRDGGIGVSQAAIDDAFANPIAIQYVPSTYGPTFKYVGQNATVVVNPQGNVVTTWGTSAAGVGK